MHPLIDLITHAFRARWRLHIVTPSIRLEMAMGVDWRSVETAEVGP